MSKYTEMKACYDKNHPAYFGMGITHLMDIGWNAAQALTDDDIAQAKSEQALKEAEAEAMGRICLMTADFVEWILTFCRNWASQFSPVETMQFVEKVKPFDLKFLK